MTKNSYLKIEIRTRMALTGESYSVAARAIAQGAELPERRVAPSDEPLIPTVISSDAKDAPLVRSKQKPNALYIGPAAVGDAIARLKPDWSFFDHVPDISTFRAGLANESIDNNIQVLMIVDKFFDQQSRDTSFEKLVASLSPYCMFCVISYAPESKSHILNRVENERFSNSFPDGKIYFVDSKRPNRTIDDAADSFIADPPVDAKDAAEILAQGTVGFSKMLREGIIRDFES